MFLPCVRGSGVKGDGVLVLFLTEHLDSNIQGLFFFHDNIYTGVNKWTNLDRM